jgi:hypothetical protein
MARVQGPAVKKGYASNSVPEQEYQLLVSVWKKIMKPM